MNGKRVSMFNAKETEAAAGVKLLAKMPSGQPISTDFLSSILGGPPVIQMHIDESSVIQGRHSTTFRLHLDRHEKSTSTNGGLGKGCGRAVNGSLSVRVPNLKGGESSRGYWPTSLFVKRMVCDELPSRSLAKWR